MSKNPRKHAEAIKAWADGATIEGRRNSLESWRVMPEPGWLDDYEYRIKANPVTLYFPVMSAEPGRLDIGWGAPHKVLAQTQALRSNYLKRLLKVELDPETYELKSATVEAP